MAADSRKSHARPFEQNTQTTAQVPVKRAQLFLSPKVPVTSLGFGLFGAGICQPVSVDQDLLGFIREHIRSVWALELLLLLRRQPPERRWAVEDLVAELRASTNLVTDNLARFERAGLVATEDDGRTRFAPAAPTLAKLCDELDAAYRQRSVAVINAIVSPPDKLQALADAFRIKGDRN
jgi:hypothetical protein